MMKSATVIHIGFQDIAGRDIDANRIRTDQAASRDEEAREELPIVGWFHFPLADPVADDFYAETVNTATAGHWDLIKIMTCGNYMSVAYGADYEFSTNPQKWDGVFHSHPITSAEDAGKLGVLDATNDTLAAEVAVDGRIVDTYKDKKPVLATLFDPLSWVQELSTPMNPDWTLELMRSDPKALTHALEALQETNDHFLDALIDKGIDGIFMTTLTLPIVPKDKPEQAHIKRKQPS